MKTILIIIAVVVLGAFGWYYFGAKAPANEVTLPVENGATTTPSTPATQTYNNTTHNFSLEYPLSYVAKEASSTQVVTFITEADNAAMQGSTSSTSTPREGPTAITIEAFPNPKKLSAGAWATSTKLSNFNLGPKELNSIELAGRDAVVYQWEGLYQGISVAVNDGTTVYVLSVTFSSPTDQIVKDFEGVYQSFQFTN